MAKLKYHHIGIPTAKPLPEDNTIQEYQLYASDYRTSDYGIEWMKFDPDCPVPEWLQTLPHGAFGVDDIRAAIAGKKVLSAPKRPGSVDGNLHFRQIDIQNLVPFLLVLVNKKLFVRTPSAGVTVAFVEDHEAPIALLQFDRPEDEIRPAKAKFSLMEKN